jgi:putative ABC transport system ATP-binding protein/lipoprotein-releasing system ATP-binding protein
MIELQGLSKSYRIGGQTVRALLPVDLSIRDGELVSVTGHSGSGKSTLLSLLGGIATPDGGRVVIDGEDLGALGDAALSRLRNEKLGFVYQFSSLLPTLTALENVLLPTVFGGTGQAEEARRLLAQVGLADKADRRPGELSGGEQQRVAIARAFVNAPRILLADEPTGDLDEETEADVMRFLEEVNRERGVTVVMVTHSSELAVRAGRRLRMKQGVLEEAPRAPARAG